MWNKSTVLQFFAVGHLTTVEFDSVLVPPLRMFSLVIPEGWRFVDRGNFALFCTLLSLDNSSSRGSLKDLRAPNMWLTKLTVNCIGLSSVVSLC